MTFLKIILFLKKRLAKCEPKYSFLDLFFNQKKINLFLKINFIFKTKKINFKKLN